MTTPPQHPSLAQRAKALFLRGAASDQAPDTQPGTGTIIIRPVPPDITAFPDSLTELDQWVLWRSEHGTKRPYSAITKRMASTTSPADWASFEAARAEFDARPGFYSGFGFVFSGDDGLAGIDLDDCILGDGSYKSWAQGILERIESYSEVSPSGRGVKIWVRAKLAGGGLKRYVLKTGTLTTEPKHPDCDGAIELYDHGRYFTVTGHKTGIVGVDYCQPEIEALYAFLSQADASKPAQSCSPRTLPATLGEGNRHPTLLSMAGWMWGKGFSISEIRVALTTANRERCNPPKPEREIEGILDWIQSQPQGELPRLPRELLPAGNAGNASPAAVPTPDPAASPEPETAVTQIYVIPEGDDSYPLNPNDLARVVMRDHKFLVYREMVYEYDGRRWEQIGRSKIEQYVLALESHSKTTQKRRKEAVSYALTAAVNDKIQWRQLADLEVPCHNGVVNIDTCEVRPHRPSDYLESVIPHDYEPRQAPHVWLGALDRWFQGDPDCDAKIDALQEFFGYCLLPHAHYKMALFLQGESNTGKSQIPIILRHLVGMENICTLNTEQMADERKRSSIVGKMINLMTELPADAMIADGGFKQLVSTGDPIDIDPKYVTKFSYVPFCKHIICTNKLPEINDLSKATFNRILLIQFHNILSGDEQDPFLEDRLVAEIGGILAWSIEGAARLVQNRGRFTEIDESDKAVKEYRESQNPVNDFIEEHCYRHDPERDGVEITDAWCITTEEFHDRFAKWYIRPISRKATKRMVESAGFEVKKKRIGSKTPRTIFGIAWSD